MRRTAITTIAYDHTAILGSSIAEIAAEKAGILKPGAIHPEEHQDVETSPQNPPAQPATAPEGLHLALKSGNFGSDDFFSKAFAALS